MKRAIKLVLPLAIVILMAACTSNQSKSKEDQKGHDNPSMEQPSASASDTTGTNENSTNRSSSSIAQPTEVSIKDDKLNAVYPYYLNLTKALTNNDVAGAKAAARAIEAGAKGLNGGSALTGNSEKIAKATDIETQRKAYAELNINFIALLKKSGLKSGELYVNYCPMKSSYWVSNNKQIRNPYFGKSMLTCGSTKETIK